MKLTHSFSTDYKLYIFSLILCFLMIFSFSYTLLERNNLLKEYSAIKFSENKEKEESSYSQSKEIKVLTSPLVINKITQISKELNIPIGKILDSLQMAVPSTIFLTQISLEDQYTVEGYTADERKLQIFIQNLKSSDVWSTVEIESEKQTILTDENLGNDSIKKVEIRFKLKLKLKGF